MAIKKNLVKFSITFLLLFLLSCSEKKSDSKTHSIDSIINSKAAPKLLYDSTNTLEAKIQTLELDYIVWGCACANWITLQDYKKYSDTTQSEGLAPHCIFIEPADSSLNIDEKFTPFKNYIRITGQFYKRKGYPKGTFETEEELDSAKIFRYTKMTVLVRKEDQ